MPEQKAVTGRIVRYVMSDMDAAQVNRRRTTDREIAARMLTVPPEWPTGAQAHIGETVSKGDEFAAMIVKAHDDGPVNLQVFLDGSDIFWARYISLGEGPGTFLWPPRE